MPNAARLLLVAALVTLLPWLPARAQVLRLEIFNTHRAISNRVFGAGHWIAFFIEEDQKDLNGDGDTDDTILCLLDQRTLAIQVTGIAVDPLLADAEDDWPVAISGDQIAVQVSEAANGRRDLNGNGVATDNILALYNPATRQLTNLGVNGRNPTFLGGKLYFIQDEKVARKDLNGDGDLLDGVLCVYDPATRTTESLGMEAGAGFRAAGDWIAARTSEAAQFGRDLNGDGDIADQVVQLYQVSQKKWTNTGLECSSGIALTPKLLAVAVDEKKQGNRDLNGDGDTGDVVCQVWDLATGKVFNTGQDCSGGLVASGSVVGFGTLESGQGNTDLNGDGDRLDVVAQAYVLGAARGVNLRYDCSGGLVADAGKIAFSCSEADQGKRDLNGDGDADDSVLLVYDPAQNRIFNTRYAVDGDLVAGEGYLAWKVLEADQGNQDLNRDGDTDDSVLFVLNLATNALSSTRMAVTDHIAVTRMGVGFGTLEADQGNRDLNMNGDTDDEVLQLARFVAR